jgi:type I restriction enzyme S subunit
VSDWPSIPLGAVVTRSGGTIQTGPFGSQLHRSDYVDGPGVPVVMPKDMVGGRVDKSTAARVSQATAARMARHACLARDVLVSRRGDIGRCALVREGDAGALCGTGSIRIRVSGAEVDPGFLFYFLSSPVGKSSLEAQTVGATMANLSATAVGLVRLPVPPLEVQRKIAGILFAFDDLIENNNRRITILEEMAQRIYREWFVDFRYPGYAEVPLVHSELGPIPEGWAVTPLGDAMELVYGKALKAEDRNGGAVRVFGSSGVVGFHDEAQAPGPGIVVGRKGNVGSVHWSQGPFFVIDTAFWVRTPLPLTYCYFVLMDMNFIDSHSSVPGLSRSQAYGLPLLTPTQPLIDRFDAIASPLFLLREILAASNGKLGSVRDLLLPRLTSGEIDIEHLDIPDHEAAA